MTTKEMALTLIDIARNFHGGSTANQARMLGYLFSVWDAVYNRKAFRTIDDAYANINGPNADTIRCNGNKIKKYKDIIYCNGLIFDDIKVCFPSNYNYEVYKNRELVIRSEDPVYISAFLSNLICERKNKQLEFNF